MFPLDCLCLVWQIYCVFTCFWLLRLAWKCDLHDKNRRSRSIDFETPFKKCQQSRAPGPFLLSKVAKMLTVSCSGPLLRCQNLENKKSDDSIVASSCFDNAKLQKYQQSRAPGHFLRCLEIKSCNGIFASACFQGPSKKRLPNM